MKYWNVERNTKEVQCTRVEHPEQADGSCNRPINNNKILVAVAVP